MIRQLRRLGYRIEAPAKHKVSDFRSSWMTDILVGADCGL